MEYFVYVLENARGKFYVGHTDDLTRRLREHNDPQPGLGKFTHKNGSWILVWSEPHPTRASAMRRERAINAWKSAKRIRQDLLATW